MKIVGSLVIAAIWICFGLFMIGLLLGDLIDEIDPLIILFAVLWPFIIVAEIAFTLIPKIVLDSIHLGNYVRKWLFKILKLEE